MKLEAVHFAEAFEAVHGYRPYAWQESLVRDVVARGEDHEPGRDLWPAVIAAPTGAGKTAVLDIALFHLALTVRQCPRPAPLRIVFAVDRRVVVDQAHERAKAIRDALIDDRKLAASPVLAAMAAALRELSGDDPLHVEALRGGLPREDDWARTPTQPTILCTTVDQLGSRLLFRGYGVSASMAPVHAGLLGQDALVILDEAHLSTAFEDTLRAVQVHQALAARPLHLPFAVTSLTATPRDGADAFRLTVDERNEDAIARRLAAEKHATLDSW